MRRYHVDEVRNLARKALQHGGRLLSPVSIEWNIGGGCQTPYRRCYHARPSPTNGKWAFVPKDGYPIEVILLTPCHKCKWCARRRAALWRRRISQEYVWSPRTWLGTLTLAPHNRFRHEAEAKRKLRLSGVDWEALPPLDQWRALHREIGRELQLYIKRVRENSGAPFRFVMIGELHKDGFPHYHCIVNEIGMETPVRHAQLKRAWHEGFSTWKLVDDVHGVTYVTKYLTKSDVSGWARVRASRHYGETPYGIDLLLKGRENLDPQTSLPITEGSIGTVTLGGTSG